MSDALAHLDAAIAALCLEAYRGRDPESMTPVEHFTIGEDLKRIDSAIGPTGESIFARIADNIQAAYVELLAARALIAAGPPAQTHTIGPMDTEGLRALADELKARPDASENQEPILWVSEIDLRAWQKAKAGEIWAWPENVEGQCIPLYAALHIHEPDIEGAAKIIYAAMQAAAKEAGFIAPAWVERGNSTMQEEARRTAYRILSPAPGANPRQGEGE